MSDNKIAMISEHGFSYSIKLSRIKGYFIRIFKSAINLNLSLSSFEEFFKLVADVDVFNVGQRFDRSF